VPVWLPDLLSGSVAIRHTPDIQKLTPRQGRNWQLPLLAAQQHVVVGWTVLQTPVETTHERRCRWVRVIIESGPRDTFPISMILEGLLYVFVTTEKSAHRSWRKH
jgi:hypothetical protein